AARKEIVVYVPSFLRLQKSAPAADSAPFRYRQVHDRATFDRKLRPPLAPKTPNEIVKSILPLSSGGDTRLTLVFADGGMWGGGADSPARDNAKSMAADALKTWKSGPLARYASDPGTRGELTREPTVQQGLEDYFAWEMDTPGRMTPGDFGVAAADPAFERAYWTWVKSLNLPDRHGTARNTDVRDMHKLYRFDNTLDSPQVYFRPYGGTINLYGASGAQDP